MRKQRVTYFLSGLLLQLMIVSLIIYWLMLVSSRNLETAIDSFASRLPSFLHDTTLIMIITAAFVTISMLCYGAARNLSYSRSFRNLTLGLVLINALILLWIILALM